MKYITYSSLFIGIIFLGWQSKKLDHRFTNNGIESFYKELDPLIKKMKKGSRITSVLENEHALTTYNWLRLKHAPSMMLTSKNSDYDTILLINELSNQSKALANSSNIIHIDTFQNWVYILTSKN